MQHRCFVLVQRGLVVLGGFFIFVHVLVSLVLIAAGVVVEPLAHFLSELFDFASAGIVVPSAVVVSKL